MCGEQLAMENQRILLLKSIEHQQELASLRITTDSHMSQQTDLIEHVANRLVEMEKWGKSNHVALVSQLKKNQAILESVRELVRAIAIG